MSVSQINANISLPVPKEVLPATAGITVAAASGVAIQFFSSCIVSLPALLENSIVYGCGAAAIAGTVVAVYSAVRLCQRVIHEKTEPFKAIAVTTLGALSTGLIQAVGHLFWEIAPSFYWLGEGYYSAAYIIGTNLAWQFCAIAGIAGIAFTAYAAYRTGQVILANLNPVPSPA